MCVFFFFAIHLDKLGRIFGHLIQIQLPKDRFEMEILVGYPIVQNLLLAPRNKLSTLNFGYVSDKILF